ncbi:MAG: hypothetical protein ACRENU_02470 [Gemmatimonadaceae bacterium]
MKRLALVVAIFAVAACSKNETPATDTTTPALAPAPMPVDSMAIKDSIRADSMRKADSAKAADTKGKAKTP